jgi:histidinol-phosphate aminotransferase
LKAQLYNLIRKEVRGQKAYAAGTPQSCRIRLDANENSFSLPPELHDEFIDALRKVALNRYPEAGSSLLRAGFAEAYGVGQDMLMLGNGSDELIQILCTSLTCATVLVPVPTFVMYGITSLNNGHMVKEVPLDNEFDLDIEAMLEQIDALSPALLFLSYPNNPTGNCFSREKMATLLKQAPGLVVVDEAYGYFSRNSFLPLLEKYENLVILKTLSKIGLAALRIGIMVGQAPLINELNKVRLPYNLNALSQAAAGFYLDHEAVFSDQAEKIIKEREQLFSALQQMQGIRPYRSEANFIFFSCLFDTDPVYEKLRQQGILIKNFPTAGNLKNCMRVTVGRPEENKIFLEALERIIAK